MVFQSSARHVICIALGFIGVILRIRYRQVKANRFSGFGLYFGPTDVIFIEDCVTTPDKPL